MRCCIKATARASPKANAKVVEVVGARPIGQASGASGSVSLKVAALLSVLPPFEEIAAIEGELKVLRQPKD